MPARELDRIGPLAQADAALVYAPVHQGFSWRQRVTRLLEPSLKLLNPIPNLKADDDCEGADRGTFFSVESVSPVSAS